MLILAGITDGQAQSSGLHGIRRWIMKAEVQHVTTVVDTAGLTLRPDGHFVVTQVLMD